MNSCMTQKEGDPTHGGRPAELIVFLLETRFPAMLSVYVPQFPQKSTVLELFTAPIA